MPLGAPKCNFFFGRPQERIIASYQLKRAIGIEEVCTYVAKHSEANTAAGRRDVAMALFLFFGIRRISEGLALCRSDVFVEHGAVA